MATNEIISKNLRKKETNNIGKIKVSQRLLHAQLILTCIQLSDNGLSDNGELT